MSSFANGVSWRLGSGLGMEIGESRTHQHGVCLLVRLVCFVYTTAPSPRLMIDTLLSLVDRLYFSYLMSELN